MLPIKLNASKLRQDIYRILDQIIASKVPVEIERNGYVLRIIPVENKFGKIKKLKKRKISSENSDNFTHIDWSDEWKENK